MNKMKDQKKLICITKKWVQKCDDFDVYVHRFSLRFLPLKNKYSWVLKPILNIIEFQFINSFMLYRESHPSPDMEFRFFLLKISQGFVKNSLKPTMTPLRVRGNELFPRNFCRVCKDVSPRKDCRTSKTCSKYGSVIRYESLHMVNMV